MRVRFLQDVIFETEGFRKGPRFDAGSVHDFAEDFAERWIRRGLAERVTEGRRRAEPSAAPPLPPPPPTSQPPTNDPPPGHPAPSTA